MYVRIFTLSRNEENSFADRSHVRNPGWQIRCQYITVTTMDACGTSLSTACGRVSRTWSLHVTSGLIQVSRTCSVVIDNKWIVMFNHPLRQYTYYKNIEKYSNLKLTIVLLLVWWHRIAQLNLSYSLGLNFNYSLKGFR